MAADLFETYAVTIIATMLVGSLTFVGEVAKNAIALPLVMGGVSVSYTHLCCWPARPAPTW